MLHSCVTVAGPAFRNAREAGTCWYDEAMQDPKIIQGGMGAAISDWRLARAVSTHGSLGVVSGTALDQVLARRLQLGDPSGCMRRALDAFPLQDIARRVIDQFFIEGGKAADEGFLKSRMSSDVANQEVDELSIIANFVEVFLAKESHSGIVGINFLHKIQTPLLAALYGALLADVDVVIVGAGIPLDIPEILDGLCAGRPVDLQLHMRDNSSGEAHKIHFDPNNTFPDGPPVLRRPRFFPIVSSATLASLMVRKSKGGVDGLVIEGPTAGGHNAPPRGRVSLDSSGQPVYGARDTVDLEAIKDLEVPFWLAGSYGSPERLQEARDAGAAGVQVGSLFAFCEESGLREDLRRAVTDARGDVKVFTDPLASPTGFPFKILEIPGTLASTERAAKRDRRCDLGFLREAYEKPNGDLGWRCPAEHPDAYVKKGGRLEDTVGRKCLCNSLIANVGMPQVRNRTEVAQPLVTCGDDLSVIAAVLDRKPGLKKTSYSAADALDYLLDNPGATPVDDPVATYDTVSRREVAKQ